MESFCDPGDFLMLGVGMATYLAVAGLQNWVNFCHGQAWMVRLKSLLSVLLLGYLDIDCCKLIQVQSEVIAAATLLLPSCSRVLHSKAGKKTMFSPSPRWTDCYRLYGVYFYKI